MKKYIKVSVIIILCFFLQIIFMRIFFPNLISPNFSFCLIIIIAFFFPPPFALIYGAITGFFVDIIADNIFGISSVFFILIVFSILFLKNFFDKNNLLIIILIYIISFSIYVAVNTGLFFALIGPVTMSNIIRGFGIEATENLLIIILFYFILKKKRAVVNRSFGRIKT